MIFIRMGLIELEISTDLSSYKADLSLIQNTLSQSEDEGLGGGTATAPDVELFDFSTQSSVTAVHLEKSHIWTRAAEHTVGTAPTPTYCFQEFYL